MSEDSNPGEENNQSIPDDERILNVSIPMLLRLREYSQVMSEDQQVGLLHMFELVKETGQFGPREAKALYSIICLGGGLSQDIRLDLELFNDWPGTDEHELSDEYFQNEIPRIAGRLPQWGASFLATSLGILYVFEEEERRVVSAQVLKTFIYEGKYGVPEFPPFFEFMGPMLQNMGLMERLLRSFSHYAHEPLGQTSPPTQTDDRRQEIRRIMADKSLTQEEKEARMQQIYTGGIVSPQSPVAPTTRPTTDAGVLIFFADGLWHELVFAAECPAFVPKQPIARDVTLPRTAVDVLIAHSHDLEDDPQFEEQSESAVESEKQEEPRRQKLFTRGFPRAFITLTALISLLPDQSRSLLEVNPPGSDTESDSGSNSEYEFELDDDEIAADVAEEETEVEDSSESDDSRHETRHGLSEGLHSLPPAEREAILDIAHLLVGERDYSHRLLADETPVKVRLSFHHKTVPGCKHYLSSCLLVCPICDIGTPCRLCHDEQCQSHELPRHDVREVICTNCNMRQPVGNRCSGCGIQFATYFCPKCNLFSSQDTKLAFHCDDCGICRIGIHEDYRHCHKCGLCWPAAIDHDCVEGGGAKECPYCLDSLSLAVSSPVICLPCKHMCHITCNSRALEQGIVGCPICCKLVLDPQAAAQWEKSMDALMQAGLENFPESAQVPRKVLCYQCGSHFDAGYNPSNIYKCPQCESHHCTVIHQIMETSLN